MSAPSALHPARRLARSVLSAQTRHEIAIQLQRMAHWSMRFTPTGHESLRRLAELKNAHHGERCVILGNGPSLRSVNLADLDGLPTFCLNRGYLLWLDSGRTPGYFVAVNDLVIEQFHHEIAQLPCPLFLPWRHRHYFQDVPNAIFFEVRWDDAFSTNACAGIAPGATVTLAALQLAFYFGFTEVVLLGIDHRFASQGPAHAVVQQQEADANHFHPAYFGPGTTWNLPDLAASEVGYARAKEVYIQAGRRVVNATDESALTVFETCSLGQALGLPERRLWSEF
jgi:hypothetical protein